MEAGAKGKTYKIGQAAKLLDVKPFVLRFWESEFKDVLVPVRTPSGQRAYTEGNVDLVREIKRLLYDEGLTIEGAKKRLRESKGARPSSAPLGKPAASAPSAAASPPTGPTAAEAPARHAAASGQPSLLAPAQPNMQPGHAEAGQAAQEAQAAANSAALAAAQAATAAAEQAAGQANRRAEALAANLSNILTELEAIRDLLG